MDKALLVSTIVDQLQRELDVIAAAAEISRENATGDEARAEDKYDTRALESSYLVQGQGRVAAELRDGIAAYRSLAPRAWVNGEPAALGALVVVEQSSGPAHYFLGPAGGGQMVKDGGAEILVVTPQSPLGRALLGRRTGDVITAAAVPPPLRQARVTRVE